MKPLVMICSTGYLEILELTTMFAQQQWKKHIKIELLPKCSNNQKSFNVLLMNSRGVANSESTLTAFSFTVGRPSQHEKTMKQGF